MNRFLPVGILVLAALYLATTGFQCGSAEVTTAKLYIQQGQLPKAEESLMKEVQKNDKNEEAWFLLGQVRHDLKKYAEMNDAFTRALALSNDHKEDIRKYKSDAWVNLHNAGVTEYNKGKEDSTEYRNALRDFETAILVNPDSSSTYYVAALTCYAMGEYKRMEDYLNETLKLNPSHPDAARILGMMYSELAEKRRTASDDAGMMTQARKAVGAYELAFKIDPTNQSVVEGLIQAYETTKQPEKALAFTRDAVNRDPNNMSYRYAYGVFLLKQSKFQESIDQFMKALEIEPDNIDATYNCGVAFLNWGVALRQKAEEKAKDKDKIDDSYKEKYRLAIPYLKKSTAERGEDANLWMQLGRVYATLNMKKEASDAFEHADKITKGN